MCTDPDKGDVGHKQLTDDLICLILLNISPTVKATDVPVGPEMAVRVTACSPIQL